jgi:hypothetical protein
MNCLSSAFRNMVNEFCPLYGLLTNPSNDVISEISKIYDLSFDYVEIGIEGPEGNPDIINQAITKRNSALGDYFI